MEIKWHLESFEHLMNDEIWQIYARRIQVFVVEQDRAFQEIDELDKHAFHLWATDENNKVVAYARIYREDDFISFGRVLTTPDTRGTGMGKELMNQVMKAIAEIYPGEPVKIHAQADKVKFYEKFGFVAHGDEYTHIHTPHIFMVKEK
ncbi:GNAT family N-acetyltransferase [Lactobacillaceae bacterium Melli_B4]